MSAVDPNERALQARLAAHSSWARTGNRALRTAPAREGLEKRIAAEYGIPDDLPPDEHAARIESARKAYFAALALKSVRSRRRAAEARRAARKFASEADQAEAELAEAGGDAA